MVCAFPHVANHVLVFVSMKYLAVASHHRNQSFFLPTKDLDSLLFLLIAQTRHLLGPQYEVLKNDYLLMHNLPL